jgi:hypothetical protein
MVPAIHLMAAAREGLEQVETGRRTPKDMGKTLRAECAEETCEPCLTTKSSRNSSGERREWSSKS